MRTTSASRPRSLSGAPFLALVVACSSVASSDAPKPVVVALSMPAFTLTPTTIPVVGTSYTLQFPVRGGRPPYLLELAKGSSLPGGLTIDGRGHIVGTPTTAGRYDFVVRISDAAGDSFETEFRGVVGATGSTTSTFTIGAPGLPAFGQDEDIGYQPFAAGPGEPWTFDVSGLPAGLAFDPATGTVSGRTSATGTSTITLTARDANGKAASGSPLTAALTVLAPQAPSSSSDTESWTIFRPDGAAAHVTIHGGAISQADAAWTVRDATGACSYDVPISGQVAGDQWTFSANGGGCNGYMTQCFAQGATTTAGAARGSLTCTTKVPGLPSDTLTGDWTASRQ